MRDETTMAVLVHLARRVREARRDLKRYRKLAENRPVGSLREIIRHREGIESEAWNALQSAKAIVFELEACRRSGA